MPFVKGQSGNPDGQPKGWQENSDKLTDKKLRKMAIAEERRLNLISALSQGKTFKEAAEISGYVSRQSAWNVFKAICKDTPEILNLMNLPLPRILQKLGDQLEAKETKFFQNKGIITDQVDVEAHEIQQNAAVQLARLHNAYPGRNEEGNSGMQVLTQIKVIIEDVSQDVSRRSAHTITAEATPT